MSNEMTDEQRDALWDEVADRFNKQPRPNDYADDAGYDEAAAEFIDSFVNLITSQKAISRKQGELYGISCSNDAYYDLSAPELGKWFDEQMKTIRLELSTEDVKDE